MNLAQQALAMNNIGRAVELLNRNRPAMGESDLRGWEWRYLWRQCQSDALFTLTQKSQRIDSLSVSRDGSLLAIGEYDRGPISIWDLRSRREIIPSLPGRRCVYSRDEDLLAVGTISSDREHFVYLRRGARLDAITKLPLDGRCEGLKFLQDGKTLAISAGGQITLWRVADGRRLAAWDAAQDIYDIGTEFDVSDPMRLAAHSPQSGSIRVFDLDTGADRWYKQAHDDRITALAFSPDGHILASCALEYPAPIKLWDAVSGELIAQLDGHRAWIGQLLFWPDGKTLASASADQTIRLWDLTKKADTPTHRVLLGHRAEVWRLALLPDNVTLVSGAKDGVVNVWDTAAARHEQTPNTIADVVCWRFTPDSKHVLTVDRQGSVVQWSGAAFQQTERLVEIGADSSDPHISEDGRFLAVRSKDSSIVVWDLKQRSRWRELDTDGPAMPWTFLDQGNKLVTIGMEDGEVLTWDLSANNKRMPLLAEKATPPDSYSNRAAVSRDKRWWVFAVREHPGNPPAEPLTLLWDSVTRQKSFLRLPDKRSVDVAFSPDGRMFAVASDMGYASLWRTATREKIATLRGFLLGAHSVAFSPDGKRLAVGSDGGEAIKVFDLESHEAVLTLEGRDVLFKQTAFSPDGNILGSLSRGGILHLWRAESPSQSSAGR